MYGTKSLEIRKHFNESHKQYNDHICIHKVYTALEIYNYIVVITMTMYVTHHY